MTKEILILIEVLAIQLYESDARRAIRSFAMG